MVHEHLCEEGEECKLVALVKGELVDITLTEEHLGEGFLEQELPKFQMCLQRGHQDPCHRLVFDLQGNKQIHIDISFKYSAPVILQARRKEISGNACAQFAEQISYKGKLLQIARDHI